MSTFIEVRPHIHETRRTTAVRLDDDFKITVREEETGKAPVHYQFNFSGVEEGQVIDGNRVTDPVAFVRAEKLGTDARGYIAVNTYHAADEATTVPAADFYWYNVKTHYEFGGMPVAGKAEAVNPAFEGTAQTFPTTIFNISSSDELRDHPLPVGNTVAVSFTPQRLYEQLGTLTARREHLKQLIKINHVNHPHFQLWLTGFDIDVTERFSTGLRAKQAIYWTWLEALTRAISVDANLQDTTSPIATVGEEKFNLFAGDAALSGADIMNKADSFVYTSCVGTPPENRNLWTFVRLGASASSAPYAYTAPTGNSWGRNQAVAVNQITLRTGVSIPSDTSWLDWLWS